jgi:hypothetical protein
VVDAVECAVAVQAVMAERNKDIPEDRRMLYRIGINLRDILIEGDDILGDGVNVAARLEGIAEPGGICISSSAYDQVSGKVAVEFTDVGEQTLKNIARPIRAYAVVRDGHGATRKGTIKRWSARRECKRLTLLPLTALRSGCHVPPRNSKVSFELRPRETLILKCLRQERPFLIRTECCSLPIQRSDGAVPAHVFQNSLPTHSLPPFPFWSGGFVHGAICEIVSELGGEGAWFANR